MRVLVTRPEPDATRQVARLVELGHEPVLAPLSRIEPIQGVRLDLGGVEAIIATSRNALRALAVHPQRAEAVRLPLFAVGEATANAASELGFADVVTGPGTGEELAELILERSKAGATVLHISGEVVAFDLKAALALHGFKVRQPVLYRSVPVKALPPQAAAAIEQASLDAVILMSPRTGTTFAALVRKQGLQGRMAPVICYCLSQAIAQTVEPLGARLAVAAHPREEDLLALLAAEAAS